MAFPAPDPSLTDGIVMLRKPGERDLDAIDRGINDPDVIRWFGQPIMTATELLELNRTRWRTGTGATFAICGPNDECVGHVFLNMSDARRGTVGYWLLPEARGLGYATRSVRLVSRWAIRDVRVDDLRLFTEPWNEASLRVAERSGFRREGILRAHGEVDGRPVDHVAFSIAQNGPPRRAGRG